MPAATLPAIQLGNDYEAEKTITKKATTTGLVVAADSLAGLEFWLSATDRGGEIHASLKKSATERTALAGTYFAIFEGDDLDTHLTAGTDVFLVFGDTTNIYTTDPVPVLDRRRTR